MYVNAEEPNNNVCTEIPEHPRGHRDPPYPPFYLNFILIIIGDQIRIRVGI